MTYFYTARVFHYRLHVCIFILQLTYTCLLYILISLYFKHIDFRPGVKIKYVIYSNISSNIYIITLFYQLSLKECELLVHVCRI